MTRDAKIAEVRQQVGIEEAPKGQKRKLSQQAKDAGDEAYIRPLEDTVMTCEREKETSKAILDELIVERRRDERAERERHCRPGAAAWKPQWTTSHCSVTLFGNTASSEQSFPPMFPFGIAHHAANCNT